LSVIASNVHRQRRLGDVRMQFFDVHVDEQHMHQLEHRWELREGRSGLHLRVRDRQLHERRLQRRLLLHERVLGGANFVRQRQARELRCGYQRLLRVWHPRGLPVIESNVHGQRRIRRVHLRFLGVHRRRQHLRKLDDRRDLRERRAELHLPVRHDDVQFTHVVLGNVSQRRVRPHLHQQLQRQSDLVHERRARDLRYGCQRLL
jgi:hypothetical protein